MMDLTFSPPPAVRILRGEGAVIASASGRRVLSALIAGFQGGDGDPSY